MRTLFPPMKVVVLLLFIFFLPSYGQSQRVPGKPPDADKILPSALITVNDAAINNGITN